MHIVYIQNIPYFNDFLLSLTFHIKYLCFAKQKNKKP